VRNRVAPTAARASAVTSKLVLVMVLVPVALVAAAQNASAAITLADGDVAASSGSFGFLGPVGIGAVVLGFGGLVVGLLRHRRREATATTVILPVVTTGALPVLDATQPVEPAPGERVG
jgi:hypothetical protein